MSKRDLRKVLEGFAQLTPDQRRGRIAALEPGQREELAALLLDYNSTEPLEKYVTRMVPHEPPQRHMQPIIRGFEEARVTKVRRAYSMPPRHGKSKTITRGLAWWLTKFKRDTCAYFTYSDEKARPKSREIRTLVQRSGIGLARDQNTLKQWRTTEGGGLIAGGRGGGATGDGVSGIFVVDDPFKNRKEADSEVLRDGVWDWFTEVAFTRQEGASYFVVHTRWHPDDLIGRLVRHHGWEWINLRGIAKEGDPLGRKVGEALWPSRITIEDLEEAKSTLGEWAFAALYDGDPQPKGGKLFREEPARYDPKLFDWIGKRGVISCDPATTASTRADHSVIGTCAMDGYGAQSRMYLTDRHSMQVETPTLVDRLQDIQKRHRLMVAVEAVGGFKAVPQTLRKQAPGLRIIEIRPPVDKRVRAEPAAQAWNEGRLLVPVGVEWADEYIRKMQAFTGVNDAEDDDADMTAHGWNTLYLETPRAPRQGAYADAAA